MFVGHTDLGKDEYNQQLLMGRSLWIAESPIGYIFVGLHCIAEDKNSAKYYFMVFRRHEGEINKVHPILNGPNRGCMM